MNMRTHRCIIPPCNNLDYTSGDTFIRINAKNRITQILLSCPRMCVIPWGENLCDKMSGQILFLPWIVLGILWLDWFLRK